MKEWNNHAMEMVRSFPRGECCTYGRVSIKEDLSLQPVNVFGQGAPMYLQMSSTYACRDDSLRTAHKNW